MSVLEIAALRRRLGALAGAGGLGGLDRHELLLERAEALGDLGSELVQRRAEPRRVEQARESRRVAVEIGVEHPRDAADRRVAPGGVEQLLDHGAQLAAVAEERLEGARQAPVAIGKVRAQDALERFRRSLVRGAALVGEALELAANGIHVQGHPDALECRQADPNGALDEDRVVIDRLRGQPARDPGPKPSSSSKRRCASCRPTRRRSSTSGPAADAWRFRWPPSGPMRGSSPPTSRTAPCSSPPPMRGGMASTAACVSFEPIWPKGCRSAPT